MNPSRLPISEADRQVRPTSPTSADVVVRALGEMIIDWWVTPQDGRPARPYQP